MGQSIKALPEESEAMDKADIIVLQERHGISKIYPPKEYRPKIIESLHSGGRKSDSMILRCCTHFNWPGMRDARVVSHYNPQNLKLP